MVQLLHISHPNSSPVAYTEGLLNTSISAFKAESTLQFN